jgi:hypothetical protein
MFLTKGGFFYCVILASGAPQSFMTTSDHSGRVPIAGVTIWNLCLCRLMKHTNSIMTEDMAFHWNLFKEIELVEDLFRL